MSPPALRGACSESNTRGNECTASFPGGWPKPNTSGSQRRLTAPRPLTPTPAHHLSLHTQKHIHTGNKGPQGGKKSERIRTAIRLAAIGPEEARAFIRSGNNGGGKENRIRCLAFRGWRRGHQVVMGKQGAGNGGCFLSPSLLNPL